MKYKVKRGCVVVIGDYAYHQGNILELTDEVYETNKASLEICEAETSDEEDT